MSKPDGFSWIDKPLLAALARPGGPEELAWLRSQGIELLISLTEQPLRRDWVNDAGLMGMHVPVEDMEPPTLDQMERCCSAIRRAHARKMGVAVHCGAGLGRTGVILACYFVDRGHDPKMAVAKVRELRPGSVETTEQSEAVQEYARRRGRS
jgi:atypical dual specificity phosphatase